MINTDPKKQVLPQVSLIAAMTKDYVIGSNAGLPWDLPEDLQLFKKLTFGNTVIMGHKTFVSIGNPLPGRHNIVLSRQCKKIEGVQVCSSFIDGLTTAAVHGKPVFVIGGTEVYELALSIANEMHISWIGEDYRGDVHFPEFELSEWQAVEERAYPGFTYVHYRRK